MSHKNRSNELEPNSETPSPVKIGIIGAGVILAGHFFSSLPVFTIGDNYKPPARYDSSGNIKK